MVHDKTRISSLKLAFLLTVQTQTRIDSSQNTNYISLEFKGGVIIFYVYEGLCRFKLPISNKCND